MAVARATLEDVRAILANDDGDPQDPNSKSPWTPHAVELLEKMTDSSRITAVVRNAVIKTALSGDYILVEPFMNTQTNFVTHFKELFALDVDPSIIVKTAIYTLLKPIPPPADTDPPPPACRVAVSLPTGHKVQGLRAEIVRMAASTPAYVTTDPENAAENTNPYSDTLSYTSETSDAVAGAPVSFTIQDLYFKSESDALKFQATFQASLYCRFDYPTFDLEPCAMPDPYFPVTILPYRRFAERNSPAGSRAGSNKRTSTVMTNTPVDEVRAQSFAVDFNASAIRCHLRPQRGGKDTFSDFPDNCVFLNPNLHKFLDGLAHNFCCKMVVEPVSIVPDEKDHGRTRLNVVVYLAPGLPGSSVLPLRDGTSGLLPAGAPVDPDPTDPPRHDRHYSTFLYAPNPAFMAAFLAVKSNLERAKWLAQPNNPERGPKIRYTPPYWDIPPPPVHRPIPTRMAGGDVANVAAEGAASEAFKKAFGQTGADMLTLVSYFPTVDSKAPEAVVEAQKRLTPNIGVVELDPDEYLPSGSTDSEVSGGAKRLRTDPADVPAADSGEKKRTVCVCERFEIR